MRYLDESARDYQINKCKQLGASKDGKTCPKCGLKKSKLALCPLGRAWVDDWVDDDWTTRNEYKNSARPDD